MLFAVGGGEGSCLGLCHFSAHSQCGSTKFSAHSRWSVAAAAGVMGGNSPSHFSEEDASGGVTVVKGIRLSDRVIKRMRQSPEVISPQLAPESKTQTGSPVPAPSVEHFLPLLTPPPPPVIATPPPSPPSQGAPAPSVEPAPGVKLIPPPPVRFHSFPPTSADPAAPPSSTPSPGIEAAVEPLPPPPVVPPCAETFTLPTSVESSHASLASPEPSPQTPPAINEPSAVTPSVEPLESAAPSPPPVETVQLTPTVESTPAEPVNPVQVEAPAAAPAVDPEPPCDLHQSPPPSEYVAEPPTPLSPVLSFEETSPSCQCVELTIAPTDPPLAPPPPTEKPPEIPTLPSVDEHEVPVFKTPPPPAAVSEEELRQKLKEEMQRSLKEEISLKRQELQRQLEELRSQARAEAKAAAQAQVEEQVKKILEAEKAAYTEKLTDSIAKERMKTEDEKLMVQLYRMEVKAHQLEEKEKELKKQEALYKEHLEKLEAKSVEFYKVSVESLKKGREETLNRFARFNIQPVCGDLQSEILKCYKENTGKTLYCSGIASAYMQCVDEAKKNKLSTGG